MAEILPKLSEHLSSQRFACYMETTWKFCVATTLKFQQVQPHNLLSFSSAITWTACSDQKSACLRWLLYGYVHHKNIHREFLHGTQFFSQKHTHTKPNKPSPALSAAISGALVILVTSDLSLWHVHSITLSPFQGKSVWVQNFFFSRTLQHRKCYWWTAPKICVIYWKNHSEYMKYFSVDACYELQVIKEIFFSYQKQRMKVLFASIQYYDVSIFFPDIICLLLYPSTSSFQSTSISLLWDFFQQSVVSRYFLCL